MAELTVNATTGEATGGSCLVLEVAENFHCTKYKLHLADENAHRDPRSWTFGLLHPDGTYEVTNTEADAIEDETRSSVHTFFTYTPPEPPSPPNPPGFPPYLPPPSPLPSPPPSPPVPPSPPAASIYKFEFTAVRGPQADAVQLSEIRVYGAGGVPLEVMGSSASNPGRDYANSNQAQTADLLFDNDTSTKWSDANMADDDDFAPSVIRFPLAIAQGIESYELVTANDNKKRDPVSWTLSMMVSGQWLLMSQVSEFPPPAERETSYGMLWAITPPPSPSPPVGDEYQFTFTKA